MLVRNELVINSVDSVFWPPEGFRRGLTLIAGKHESTAANATSGQLSWSKTKQAKPRVYIIPCIIQVLKRQKLLQNAVYFMTCASPVRGIMAACSWQGHAPTYFVLNVLCTAFPRYQCTRLFNLCHYPCFCSLGVPMRIPQSTDYNAHTK